jgi:UDP-GlcNAc:undecaprenyl-phosphate/decaprenyl-phosphate GlcNAc-1-phosphate transferase
MFSFVHGIVLTVVVYGLIVWVSTDWIYSLLRSKPYFLSAANYEGKPVLNSFGILIFFHYACFIGMAFIIGLLVRADLVSTEWVGILVLFGLLSVMGWLDDRYGKDDEKGLSGHLGALLKRRRITTGMWKALVGTLLGLWLGLLYSESARMLLVNGLVFALSIHVINLLDLRPGRALKSFWLLLAPLFLLLGAEPWLMLLWPVLASTACIFQYDRRRQVMLGDAGSMLLGGVLGFTILYTRMPELSSVYLLIFAALTIAAEKISFSAMIQKNALLSKIDSWGIR